MYKYKALVDRVIDGDTVTAVVELGFNIKVHEVFRMVDYDAPESYRPKSEEEREAGNKATEDLKRMVEGKEVVLHSSKHGKYRWLGEIFLPDDTLSVNQKMIKLGHIK